MVTPLPTDVKYFRELFSVSVESWVDELFDTEECRAYAAGIDDHDARSVPTLTAIFSAHVPEGWSVVVQSYYTSLQIGLQQIDGAVLWVEVTDPFYDRTIDVVALNRVPPKLSRHRVL